MKKIFKYIYTYPLPPMVMPERLSKLNLLQHNIMVQNQIIIPITLLEIDITLVMVILLAIQLSIQVLS